MSLYFFKWTPVGGMCRGYQYSLPKNGVPGQWHSKKKARKPIQVCHNGFHVIPLDEVYDYESYGPNLYLVECNGKFESGSGKVAFEEIRFIKKIDHLDQYKVGIKKFTQSIIDMNFLPDGVVKNLNQNTKGNLQNTKLVNQFII